MIYLSQARLMLESEQTISEHAENGLPAIRRVCSQLLSEPPRYERWHVRHEHRMEAVADLRLRQRQLIALRSCSLEQIHGSALVRYLRDYHIVGEDRDRTLREFFGVADSRDAALMAHRDYLLSASSQVCSTELLGLANDDRGVELLNEYEVAYGQFFSMFCEASLARQVGEPYLLASLIPEVRSVAVNLRRRILEGDSRRARRRGDPGPRSLAVPLAIESHKLVRVQRGA